MIERTRYRFRVVNRVAAYLRFVVIAAAVLSCGGGGFAVRGQTPPPAPASSHSDSPAGGARRRVALVITNERIIDARVDVERSIIERALRADPINNERHRTAHNAIASKLNRYMRERKNLAPAAQVSNAEYIVFFNLLEYRFILSGFYPYGELYVIANPAADGQKALPRVVWKSKKVQWAGDAARDMIKELKSARKL